MPYKEKRRTLHILQVYRGLAALMVVGYHATLLLVEKYHFYGFWGGLSWGFSGVHLFFVLSGFIICFIHYVDINRPHRAGIYLYKRFARIYPTYWVVLLVSLPALLLGISHLNGYHLFENLTLLRISNHDKFVAVAWTLSHEIMFYLVFLTLILNRFFGLAACRT
jgi:peptidoglycan/LPS O-acetylase OafA/YrhL